MKKYNFDSTHSTIEFSARNMIVSSVRGRFTNFAGLIALDPDDLARSKVLVEIDGSSILTDNPRRDADLRSAEFFDVATYPLISFASERIEVEDHHLRVTGALTMRGVTREVTLDVEPLGSLTDPYNRGHIALSASTVVDRSDLFKPGVMAALMGERVTLTFDIRGVSATAGRPGTAQPTRGPASLPMLSA